MKDKLAEKLKETLIKIGNKSHIDLSDIRIEIKENKQSNPRDLLDLLTSSGTPDEFARNLDSIQDKIEQKKFFNPKFFKDNDAVS